MPRRKDPANRLQYCKSRHVPKTPLGFLLRAARHERNLALVDVGAAANVHFATIQKWELGVCWPRQSSGFLDVLNVLCPVDDPMYGQVYLVIKSVWDQQVSRKHGQEA